MVNMLGKLGAARDSRVIGRMMAAIAAMVLIAGCAADRAFREGQELVAAGQFPEGFAKVEEALEHDPRNINYRLFLSSNKEAVLGRLFSKADALREKGQLTEAEAAYQQVLRIDPHHALAKVGLERLSVERRHRVRTQEAEALLKAGERDRAKELVRLVLAENPLQREARNLEGRILEQEAREIRQPARLAETFRQPVSLEFRDAPIRAIFDVLSKVSGINFVFDRDIRADLKTTIFVKNTPMDEAIRIIGLTSQLETRVLNGNSILVYPSNPQKLKDYQQLAVRSFNLANADAKQAANTLKTLLKVRDVVVNERLNLLLVRDTPEVIRLAEKLIALEDVSEPEVMLEVEVLEVKRSRLLDFGIQWPGQIALTPLGATASGTGTTTGSATLTLDRLRNLNSASTGVSVGSTTIKAQKDDSDANILANPRIRVRNREKARILIGDRVPVITSTSTSTGFVSDSVNYVDVGLKLEVEPNIFLDDEVSIKVNLEVSNLVREITTKSGTLSYQIGTRNASTVLRLRDGETQVLAGLINDEDRRVASSIPGIGELPILNRIFGAQKDDVQKTEIVLSITPRLVRTIRRPDILNAEFDVGTESSIGAIAPTLSGPAEPPNDMGGRNDGQAGTAGKGASSKPVGAESSMSGSPSAVPQPAAGTGPVSGVGTNIEWEGPRQVRAGELFSVVLRLTSATPLSALPLLVGYDPAVVQVASVTEGDFLRQGGGQTSFSNRIDPIAGRVFVGDVRQNGTVTGTGSVVNIQFKAVQPASQAVIRLLSVTPEPPLADGGLSARDLVVMVQ